ncbi:MAG: hypothetical protein IJ125_06095 [Atopobiaceae bacterium]|nr:hypothetical protein [Atopobiaceae bacterium]
MEITSFSPIIVTKEPDATIELFEELGFKRKHHANISTGAVNIDMVSDNGFRVDVASAVLDQEQDMTIIRMNVRNFDEAYQILIDHGFINTRGDDTLDTGSAKAATMVSPTGFKIALNEHFRK